MLRSALKALLPLVAVATAAFAACAGSASKDAAGSQTTATDQSRVEAAAPAPKPGVVNEAPEGTAAIPPADLPIVVDFNATWCGPCRLFAPVFEAAASKYKDKFYFYAVDVDQCPAMARSFAIEAIPTTAVIYPDGHTVTNQPGLMNEAEFDALLGTL